METSKPNTINKLLGPELGKSQGYWPGHLSLSPVFFPLGKENFPKV